jgi:two-component system, chemotaxis family, protein-glutamate methylesterase/glutaminase
MPKRDIVVIGGSAGSGAVLKSLLRALPKDLPASVFVTTHVPTNLTSYLPEVLASAGPLPVTRAIHGQPIEPGRVYVAGRDRHLLLLEGAIFLGAGPRENMVRPAIDPMFRSAALSYGSRTTGVVLTGMLNDGASGLSTIEQMGGTAVVQHPLDAEAADMPRAAIEAVQSAQVVRADELGGLIEEIVGKDAPPSPIPSNDLVFDVDVAAGGPVSSQRLRQFANPATLTCPDCQGVLSEVKGSTPLRYRCQIGHAYSAEVLAAHTPAVDEAIRIAMRVMEERVELVSRMARDARDTGRTAIAELYEERAREYSRYADTLRHAGLMNLNMRQPTGDQPI